MNYKSKKIEQKTFFFFLDNCIVFIFSVVAERQNQSKKGVKKMKNYRFSLDLLQVNLGFIMGFVACNLKNPALKSNKRSETK